MKNPFTMKNAVKKRSRKKAFSAEKPLGKNEKRWKKCPVEDSCWDACIVKGHKCLTWVAYEQGKKEAEEAYRTRYSVLNLCHKTIATDRVSQDNQIRKQTLSEVLKEIKKYKLFWKGQKDTFSFSKEMRFNLMHQLDLIERYLKRKVKVASK